MKVAVLGGSGFIGYSTVKYLLMQPDVEVTVYCTSAKGLSNLARHGSVDIKYVPYSRLGDHPIDKDTGMLINIAHPFAARDGFLPDEQLEILIQFIESSARNISRLKVIHISTMSAYEPFLDNILYEESSETVPPKQDKYAYSKHQIEARVRAVLDTNTNLLILRPTVVYGPFGRPWTDNLFRQFIDGDVGYSGLDGKIQPMFVDDLGKIIAGQVRKFIPGIYNIAGNEIVSWQEFLGYFSSIVGKGKLCKVDAITPNETRKSLSHIYWSEFKKLTVTILKDPSFQYLIMPFYRHFPNFIKKSARNMMQKVRQGQDIVSRDQKVVSPFCDPFFARDRLVSLKKSREVFPGIEFRTLEQARDKLEKYYRYRFTDETFI